MNKDDLLICAQQCLKDEESCPATECRYNIDYEDEFNCSLISIYKNGPMSLREIAKREGLSFAERSCSSSYDACSLPSLCLK